MKIIHGSILTFGYGMVLHGCKALCLVLPTVRSGEQRDQQTNWVNPISGALPPTDSQVRRCRNTYHTTIDTACSLSPEKFPP